MWAYAYYIEIKNDGSKKPGLVCIYIRLTSTLLFWNLQEGIYVKSVWKVFLRYCVQWWFFVFPCKTCDSQPSVFLAGQRSDQDSPFRMACLSLRSRQAGRFPYQTCLQKSLNWRQHWQMRKHYRRSVPLKMNLLLSELRLPKLWPCKNSKISLQVCKSYVCFNHWAGN